MFVAVGYELFPGATPTLDVSANVYKVFSVFFFVNVKLHAQKKKTLNITVMEIIKTN